MKEEKLPEEMKDLADYPIATGWQQKKMDTQVLVATKFITPTLSGLGLLSKTKRLSVQFGFKKEGEEHNREGIRSGFWQFSSCYLQENQSVKDWRRNPSVF